VDSNQGVGHFLLVSEPPIHDLHAVLESSRREKMWFYSSTRENTATFQALDSSFKVKFPLHPFSAASGLPRKRRARQLHLCR